MNGEINGSPAPQIVGEMTQTIKCGAAIHITPEVVEHGIIFIHPDLPIFKLFLNKKGDKIEHRFELCKPIVPEVKRFAIEIVPSSVVMPNEVADPKAKAEEAPQEEKAAEEAPQSGLIIP